VAARRLGVCSRAGSTHSWSIFTGPRSQDKPDSENEDRYVIEVSDASDFPEVLCWRSDGFVNEMASQHGQPDLWGWNRPAPDRIVFHMLRPV
jgi:hypothetical protein